ncbi:MAG: hypothetical protein DRG20_06375 [Deltaproteobacteria bacterium]|nr:MAG: hypothetical protein DRG20_06375 [Deltaproteobacteria bacterium]
MRRFIFLSILITLLFIPLIAISFPQKTVKIYDIFFINIIKVGEARLSFYQEKNGYIHLFVHGIPVKWVKIFMGNISITYHSMLVPDNKGGYISKYFIKEVRKKDKIKKLKYIYDFKKGIVKVKFWQDGKLLWQKRFKNHYKNYEDPLSGYFNFVFGKYKFNTPEKILKIAMASKDGIKVVKVHMIKEKKKGYTKLEAILPPDFFPSTSGIIHVKFDKQNDIVSGVLFDAFLFGNLSGIIRYNAGPLRSFFPQPSK